jgi:hypothetical protein
MVGETGGEASSVWMGTSRGVDDGMESVFIYIL